MLQNYLMLVLRLSVPFLICFPFVFVYYRHKKAELVLGETLSVLIVQEFHMLWL